MRKNLLKFTPLLAAVFLLNACSQDNIVKLESEPEMPVVNGPIETVNEPSEAVNEMGAEDEKDSKNDWTTYKDEKYAYEFQYPKNWGLINDSSSEEGDYHLSVWTDEPETENNIQIVGMTYGVNADGSVTDRESTLDMLKKSGYEKIAVDGGDAYFFMNEALGGFHPTAYLVNDKNIFLMSYNIYSASATATETEAFFKKIISTFKFN